MKQFVFQEDIINEKLFKETVFRIALFVTLKKTHSRLTESGVEILLGHEQIDTTLRYAMLNQNNVKM